MSRFFRSVDSSSSSEDEGEEEIDGPATSSPNKHTSSSPAGKSGFETPSQGSALSLAYNNHADAVNRDNSSQQWTSHHKDVLLHALLEYWSVNETVGGHQRAASPDDSVEAQARYQRLVSQLATLNVLPESFGQDQHASTRQGYREALSVLGRQPSDVAVPSGARRLLTDGSGDAVLSLYSGLLEPLSEISRDQLALQAPLRRLLGHTAQQGGYMPPRSEITPLPLAGLMQHGSMSSGYERSRYRSDFEELSVLGKGGYGIVYHARNRLDNQAYAVKKVPLSAARLYRIRNRGQAEVDEILMELRTLARLHHPNIVRYHNAWVDWAEATTSEAIDSGLGSYGVTGTQDAQPGAESSQVGNLRRIFTDEEIDGTDIVFEHSGAAALPESQSSETTSLEHSDEPGQLRHTRTGSTLATVSDETVESIDREPEVSVSIQSTAEGAQFAQPTLAIHIQMSLHPMTLADLLGSKAENDDCLQHCYHLEPSVGIAKTVLEGLEYLHEEGVAHRDIKPANIFLTPSKSRGPKRHCVDLRKCGDCDHPSHVTAAELEVCIGDFGLAAVASPETDRYPSSSSRPVGTAIYRPTTSEQGSVDLDIYALGILFFELVWKFHTKMERQHILHELKEGRYPDGFGEWVGKGRRAGVMKCIDCMLAQDGKSVTFPELREKLTALVPPWPT